MQVTITSAEPLDAEDLGMVKEALGNLKEAVRPCCHCIIGLSIGRLERTTRPIWHICCWRGAHTVTGDRRACANEIKRERGLGKRFLGGYVYYALDGVVSYSIPSCFV
jgi:hypothetical protein